MGLRDDLKRLEELINDESRDFREYLKHGNVGQGRAIPQIDPPEYDYNESGGGLVRGNPWRQMMMQMAQQPAGPGQPQQEPFIPGDTEDGRPKPGTPIPKPGGGGAGEGDEAGEEEGEHGYMPIDDEDFIDLMEEAFDFELDPTEDANASTITEGEPTETRRAGPQPLRYDERFMRRGTKRAIAMEQETEFAEELLKVDGVEPEDAYWWMRNSNKADLDDIEGADHDLNPSIRNISLNDLEDVYEQLGEDEQAVYDSIDTFLEEVEREDPQHRLRKGDLKPQWRRTDEKYRDFDIDREEEYNLVMFNVRDVSGSMGEEKRDLVERIFWPINRYLKAKYDSGVIVSVVHDSNSWEVENTDFFGLESGGGTTVESGYELVDAIANGEFEEFYEEHGETNRAGEPRILEDKHPSGGYPDQEWNRYVLGAGDGDNHGDNEYVAELMHEIEANQHGYFDIRPGAGDTSRLMQALEQELGEDDDYVLDTVSSREDIPHVIESYLDEKGGES
ncbi:MAG: YeaH/YhbH family protein [Candidatus Nanohaloarchaeota archaeon QJJ-5]|nr:YeaH/YhbH family protein [Candidatus Nanohaloarchaeota archaeon QJJ-5]